MSVDILLRLREQQKHAEAGQPAGFLKDIWRCAADEIEQLRSLLAAYVADEDRFNKGDAEPYGSISTETGMLARAALKRN